MDPELNEAIESIDKKLTIFSEPALQFYLSMKKQISDYNHFQIEYDNFLKRNNQNLKIYEDKSGKYSWKDKVKAEKAIMPKSARYFRELMYRSLTLLYSYSIFIEDALNHNPTIKFSWIKRYQYINIGLKYSNTDYSWTELVSAASNYSRHFGEWHFLLNSVSGIALQEKLLQIKKKNALAYSSINKLISLPKTQEEFSNGGTDLTQKIIQDLELNNFQKSLKYVELWLLRIQKIWASELEGIKTKEMP